MCFFPTCQVRVVRFYQSCSPHHPPPRPPPPPSSSSASSSSSTTSASTSTSTVALPTLGQALRQLRGSVRTAGPQPGLSAHRWTSTWDLPSSVRTAGPQPGAFRAQCAPLDLKSQIECQKICQVECQKICQIECQIERQKICQIECQKICQ